MSLEQFLMSSTDWVALLTLTGAVLPVVILPVVVLGYFRARSCNKTRVYLRLLYLMLPWLPFAALAGAFMMSVSSLIPGILVATVFVLVRLYFVFANSNHNGLNAAAAR